MIPSDFFTYVAAGSLAMLSTATSIRLIMTARRPLAPAVQQSQLHSQYAKQSEIVADAGEGNAQKLTRELTQATSMFAPQISRRIFVDADDTPPPPQRKAPVGDACSAPVPPNNRVQFIKESRHERQPVATPVAQQSSKSTPEK